MLVFVRNQLLPFSFYGYNLIYPTIIYFFNSSSNDLVFIVSKIRAVDSTRIDMK